MRKRKGLGKGLDTLLNFGEEKAPNMDSAPSKGSDRVDQGRIQEMPVELLQRGKYQPRRDINPDALDELAESIRSQGIMQPIIVRPMTDDKFEIIAGERRWRAAQLVGLSVVPAIVRSISDEDAIALALIENLQREDLNAMEEALALTRLQEEFNYSQQQVADAIGKPRSTVANIMRLTALEPEVALLVERGDINMGHGRALLGLEGLNQLEAARHVVGKGLSVRQTENLVQQLKRGQQAKVKSVVGKTADTERLEQKLSESLGADVRVEHTNKGKGRLVICYNSLDELDGILSHIK